MIIQHNISAMNTKRKLGINSSVLAKSSKRLSSGYRINVAGDDAAGLAISEKMRGQIRGLSRASQNAEDGISLIQTAEGAMQESQSILHRMRELSVQAANDVNTSEDRNHIAEELKQLTQELDRIATTTEFNTMKLIDGTYSPEARDVNTLIQQYLKGAWLKDGLDRIEAALGIKIDTDSTLKVEFKAQGANAIASMSSVPGSNAFTLTINSDMVKTLKKEDFTTGSGPLVGGILFDRVLTHEMVHSVCFYNKISDQTGVPDWFSEGISEAVQGHNRTNPETPAGAKASVAGGDAYEMGYYIVSYMAYNTQQGTFTDFLKDIGSVGFNDAVKKYYGDADGVALLARAKAYAAADIDGFLNSSHITLGDGKADALMDFDHPAESVVPNSGGPEEIRGNVEKLSLNGHTWTVTWDNPVQNNNKIRLQIGANSGQEMDFSIGDMRSVSLIGADEVDVSNHDMASASITRFDQAIKRVSAYRSTLGAAQNRLEHTVANLDNAAENLTSAESRIRDTDMAKEMVTYSKQNILLQATVSMLSQANQWTSSVIQLLQ